MANANSLERDTLSELTKRSSIAMAVTVVGILIVMMVPMPTVVLDLLLAFNITLSVMILLMCMYILKPLDFSVFPSILLTVTLLRLSLNVASTRLILLHGNEGTDAAGKVIQAFGTFVVGGSFLVGLIVFLVLVLINFVVITKGATRIAEVAARFTLDAMPGKQMSIDADLNAGLITDSEARRRRSEIEREANFYGAMDGASKFVRGDAIAGIIIVFVNIVGGLIVGVMQQGMEIADAAQNYTLLTVGDGLVSQVPALIVSTASGILVTRSTASTELGDEVRNQLFAHPRAFAMVAFMLFAFAMIPGMPKMSFLLVSAMSGAAAFRLFRIQDAKGRMEIVEEEPPPPPADTPEYVAPLDTMGIEVGYGLIPFVDAAQGGALLKRIKALRRQLAAEMGFIMPSIHIRDNLQLKPNEYVVLLKGVDIARGEVMPGYHLALVNEDRTVKGIETKEPAFGLPAVWIPEREKDQVQAKGYVVVDPATVVTTHLTELVKSHADELLGRQEVQSLMDHLARAYPKTVEELVGKVVPIQVIQKVLQRLLRERVPVRDLVTILETIADYVNITKNVDVLTGYVRQALARTITKQFQNAEGSIPVMILSPDAEDSINRSIQHTEHESFIAPDPTFIRKLTGGIQKLLPRFTSEGIPPVILCSPGIRIHVRRILEKYLPSIAVLSHNEITRETGIQSVGVIEA